MLGKRFFVFQPGCAIVQTEAQGHGMTFKVCYIGSKYPYSKKTGPWNGHSWGISPSLKPEGISENGTNTIHAS